MVEVTRLRAEPKNTEAQAQTPATANSPLIDERLADTICDKLGQLLPQRSNVLLVGVDALSLTDSDLYATMIYIQQRAERAEETFWQRYGFRDRSDFFRHYQRLGEVLVRGKDLEEVGQTAVCSNPQAKHPLPSKIRTALYRSHAV